MSTQQRVRLLCGLQAWFDPNEPNGNAKDRRPCIFWRAVNWIPGSRSEFFAHGRRMYERMRDGYGEAQGQATIGAVL